MLLFVLLEAGLLKAERGDAVVFNNTSAEHPETYEFVKQCKQIVERKYRIPFFWVEYQTYEDALGGEYIRQSSVRLVNTKPFSSDNPHGYHWKGEVFEEMLSLKGYVPTLYQRICTQTLKLESSRAFLKEWLANKNETERLGHFGKESRIDKDEQYNRHLRNSGSVPRKIFLAKKEFVNQRPFVRESQRWKDYSKAAVPFKNKVIAGKTLGRDAYFGDGGIEYISFVGLRYDEMRRVVKVQRRHTGGKESIGYEGEHVYMPLASMLVTSENVQQFWDKQTWGLKLNKDDHLSNCTYCFLKGAKRLRHVHNTLKSQMNNDFRDTPSDIHWWVKLEEKYGRDIVGEKREVRANIPGNFIGFFDIRSEFSYKKLAEAKTTEEVAAFDGNVLPCDCTD